MDLFGPLRTVSLGGKVYGYVIVDDYSRYTWVSFLEAKSKTFSAFSEVQQSSSKESEIPDYKYQI